LRGGGGQPFKLIAIFAIFTLSFISLTVTTFPTQQAQAFTSPICGLASGSAGPVTATTVIYGGKKFDVIGYNKGGNEVGVAGPNNSVTLLLNKDETYITNQWNTSGNTYQGSTISGVMNTFLGTLGTDAGIIERTLTGGSTNQGTGGYIEDLIAGSNVTNQKVWPLSVDEASHLILSTRVFPVFWWLRSPGFENDVVAQVGNLGAVRSGGDIVADNHAIRPALYLALGTAEGLIGTPISNSLPIGACTRELTNLGIDYVAETITGLDTATEGWKIGPTYAGLGAFAPQASTSTNIAGTITNSTKSLVFVKAADDNDHFDSDKDRNGVAQQLLATTINIPARPAGPNVTGIAPSSPGGSDGKITGTSNKMEYTQDPALVTGLLGSGLLGASPGWIDITGGELTGLTSGTYFVRTIADQSTSNFKSFATEVIVKDGSSPSAGPSAGKPGSGNSGPSSGDGSSPSEGTAQTGVDLLRLGLLLAMMLIGAVVLRESTTETTQPEIAASPVAPRNDE
jgi:hypothetical protein